MRNICYLKEVTVIWFVKKHCMPCISSKLKHVTATFVKLKMLLTKYTSTFVQLSLKLVCHPKQKTTIGLTCTPMYNMQKLNYVPKINCQILACDVHDFFLSQDVMILFSNFLSSFSCSTERQQHLQSSLR